LTEQHAHRDARIVTLMLALACLAAGLTVGHRVAVGVGRPAELLLLGIAVPVLGGLALLLWRSPALLTPIVATLCISGAVYLSLRAGYAAAASPDRVALRADLTHCAAWAPLVFLLSVIGLPARRARMVNVGFWVVLVGLAAIGLASTVGRQIEPLERYVIAEWFLLGHGLFLVFLELYAATRRRAAMATRAWGEARTDRLTGVANRRALEEEILRDLERAGTGTAALSVILLDSDHFKAINDRHGHAAGDQVLVTFSQLLERTVRTGDVVGRWGGEEFLIVLRRTRLRDAALLAERLRASIASTLFPVAGRVTASFGVAHAEPGDVLIDLVGRADKALYSAKSRGRNRAIIAG